MNNIKLFFYNLLKINNCKNCKYYVCLRNHSETLAIGCTICHSDGISIIYNCKYFKRG